MGTAETVLTYRAGTVVLRDLDYRDCGFWLVPMSSAELEGWWSSQPTFSANPDGAYDKFYRVFDETPPPHSRVVLPGQLLTAETQAEVDLWCRMAHDGRHCICNICCDRDSYLKRPDGSVLYHRGFSGEAYPEKSP